MRAFLLGLLCLCLGYLNAQTITGTFSGIANQQVKLIGFDGFNTYTIAETKANDKGHFVLSYAKKDYGMGYLAAADNKSFFVVLDAAENLILKGVAFSEPESIEILEGKQNLLFEKYASEHPRREQALSAWDYLERIYTLDSLFAVQSMPKNAIIAEKMRIKEEDIAFLKGLAPQSYISWYLPLRKRISAVSTIAQYRTDEIPATIAAFRATDYTDPRLYKSGLLNDLIESHFWLIENSGRSLDSVFIEMNKSIDLMLPNLVSDEKKFNDITDRLFKLLERRSLFGSSEYLALKVLNETSCTVNSDLAAQMESYRAMKKGNTAPDFVFTGEKLSPGYSPAYSPQKLSDIKSKYVVVVFGASWCPNCPGELTQIANLYPKWKSQNVEVVFVGLDESKQQFNSLAGTYPFISVCDLQKWESPVAKAYHVFATPTIFLLDDKRTILLRPNSASHLDSWVDWFLVKGNR